MEANHLETLRKQRTIDRTRERLNTREGRPVQTKTSKDPKQVREMLDLEGLGNIIGVYGCITYDRVESWRRSLPWNNYHLSRQLPPREVGVCKVAAQVQSKEEN